MQSNVVLTPKGRGGCHGIGLLEVLCKIIAIIIDQLLSDSIEFHNILYGFIAWRITGTTTLEAKIIQQIAGLRKEVLYLIYFYLHKESEALDWGNTLAIL